MLIQSPPINSQIIFMMVDRQPDAFSLCRISFPNGHNARTASFRVCRPNGIPIMVMIRIKLEIKYSMAIKMPPKSSQIMFPRILI